MTDCVNKIYTMETMAACDSDILQISTSGGHPDSIESVNSDDKVDNNSQNIIHATDKSEFIYSSLCPICQEDFKEPKLLPCSHHLCRKCLIASYNSTSATFLCPVCRRCIQNYEKQTHPVVNSDTQGKNAPVNLAADTSEVNQEENVTFMTSVASENASSKSESLADSLPTDTVVAALIDGKHILQSPHVCNGCESGAEAVNFCFHCGDKLCISCSACHARLACTRHHEVKPLLDLTPVQLAIYTREHCPLHADQYLDLYCPVHSQPMCIQCVSENHADCTAIITITKAAQQQRWILEQQIEKVNKANNSLEELSKNICHRQEALSGSQQSSCHEVSRLFARLRAVLVSCEEKLTAAVNEVSSPLQGYLQEQSASVEHDRKCLAAYLEHTANFFRTTSHVNITRMSGTLVACGARLVAEIPSFLVKSSTEVVVLDVDNSFVSQIEELCHKLGRVKVTSLESLSTSSSTATVTCSQQKSPLESLGGNDDELMEDYEPQVDFKPVIELTELVQVKTGEEDEVKIFGDRAKLFRFDSDVNQWKERGLGELKILKSKERLRFRIIMRREQVLKVCANHYISEQMKLTPLRSSDRAWCYTAQDFAEEEMKIEKLAIKFKNADKAKEFKSVFEDCCKQLVEAQLNAPVIFAPLSSVKVTPATPAATDKKTGRDPQDLEMRETVINLLHLPNDMPVRSDFAESQYLDLIDNDGNEDLGHFDDESHVVEEEEEEEESTEEDEEQRVEFEKRVILYEYKDEHWEKLGMGRLRVLYNQDIESNSVDFVTDSNRLICNHIIYQENSINLDLPSKSCEWWPLDFITSEPIHRHFKAVFISEPAAQEFANIFRQGQQLAAINEISEKLSEIDVPEDFAGDDLARLF